MPIHYATISWHGVPLVDCSLQVGTFRKFAENFHQVFDPDLKRASYKCVELGLNSSFQSTTKLEFFSVLMRWLNNYVHVLCGDDKLVFICIGDLEISKEHAFRMLSELKLQFRIDFSNELKRHSRQRSKPLRYEMNTEFGQYLEHTMKRFNKTGEEGGASFIDLEDDPRLEGSILEVELDPMRTRKRIKTPLLSQPTGDIHKSSYAYKRRQTIGTCNRCLLRFPCIMVTVCIILGMFVLAFLIFILPSCGPLLKGEHCVLFHPIEKQSQQSLLFEFQN